MKKNCFCRKCPVPTCVTVATFCSLNAVKAHMVPCGAVSFYLSKLWDAKCKGDTHSSWLSPDIHPRLHLQEPLNNVRGSGASSPESLAKLTWAKSTKKKKKKATNIAKAALAFGRYKHDLVYCDFQLFQEYGNLRQMRPPGIL